MAGPGPTGGRLREWAAHPVSDRDPTPVRNYLRELSDAELAPVEVKRPDSRTWLLRTTRP